MGQRKNLELGEKLNTRSTYYLSDALSPNYREVVAPEIAQILDSYSKNGAARKVQATKREGARERVRAPSPLQFSRGAVFFFFLFRSLDGLSWKRGTNRSLYVTRVLTDVLYICIFGLEFPD